MITVPQNIKDAISLASRATGVPEDLLTGIAYIESHFKPGVINGTQTSKTQVSGLFQITGATWKAVRKDGAEKSLDINAQAYTAALLLRKLSIQYNNNRDLIAIAYNAGEGVANRLKGKEITYDAVKQAVAPYIGTKGFGYDKVQEVFQYPRKLAEAMEQPITTGSSVPINAINQTNNKDNSVTSTTQTKLQKFNKKFSVIENFTLEDSGTALAKLNSKILNTPNLEKTQLVKRIKHGKNMRTLASSAAKIRWGR